MPDVWFLVVYEDAPCSLCFVPNYEVLNVWLCFGLLVVFLTVLDEILLGWLLWLDIILIWL